MCYSKPIIYLQTGFNEVAVLTIGSKKTLSLIHNGYEFKKHRITSSGASYWLCRKQRDLKCKAKAYTKQFGIRNLVKVTGEHSHPPE